MITTLLLTVLAFPGLLLLWSAQSFQANKAKAKTTGLPLLERWISPMNLFWMMFGSTIVLKCRSLGIGTKHFRQLGTAFMLVTPGGIWLCVSDASIFTEVLHRRTDFRRNMEQFAVVNVYGKNLSTTDDEEWQKHRKVTAITFTGRNNELVWQQSLSQAHGMLEYWLHSQPINTVSDDTKVFTLNVLAAAIFNKPYRFEGAAVPKAHSGSLDDSNTYRDSLGKILANIIPILICGEQAGLAIATFRSYVKALIQEERDAITHGAQKNQHLVAALVRACASEELNNAHAVPGDRNMTLTEDEIISDLFVYAFAGNDTTAIALNNLLVHLAAHPETQDWIGEEIRHYLTDSDPKHWDYQVFPKLKRFVAALTPQRWNPSASTTLWANSGRDVTLPPGTTIHLSLAAMHTHPDYWGQDSLTWNPHRFISTPDSSAQTLESEILAPDTQKHFVPWAAGQRVCPGKKFSQVELVTTLAYIFRDYTVHPQPRAGENMSEARRRVFKTSLEIEHEGKILHEMRYPGSVALTWRKRDV
ncbi:cytochrome P450 [Ophiobolus disseminans]|uniref:Cytochrome P450 n=1 Tax=Ophiobolus disseminans TaxID=1469910 RepID=A0A6A6ZP70_9PLEO|nr:cytochrome P450 [Ophiobolus disseminans]